VQLAAKDGKRCEHTTARKTDIHAHMFSYQLTHDLTSICRLACCKNMTYNKMHLIDY
jgi:hypothetical protein